MQNYKYLNNINFPSEQVIRAKGAELISDLDI